MKLRSAERKTDKLKNTGPTTEKICYAFTRLRLSSHRLEVETGRWHKPNAIPLENRVCSTCRELEDEYHFMLECPRYHDLRVSLIPNYYRTRPNMFKLIELFSTNSKRKQRNISLYIFKAFKVREQYIFV